MYSNQKRVERTPGNPCRGINIGKCLLDGACSDERRLCSPELIGDRERERERGGESSIPALSVATPFPSGEPRSQSVIHYSYQLKIVSPLFHSVHRQFFFPFFFLFL